MPCCLKKGAFHKLFFSLLETAGFLWKYIRLSALQPSFVSGKAHNRSASQPLLHALGSRQMLCYGVVSSKPIWVQASLFWVSWFLRSGVLRIPRLDHPGFHERKATQCYLRQRKVIKKRQRYINEKLETDLASAACSNCFILGNARAVLPTKKAAFREKPGSMECGQKCTESRASQRASRSRVPGLRSSRPSPR